MDRAYRLPPVALERPPGEVAAQLCLQLANRVTATAERLCLPGDPRALHDFRVSLRRLRAALTAFRGSLAARGIGRIHRKLRKLSRMTSPARELEVDLGMLIEARLAVAGASEEMDALIDLLERRRAVLARAAIDRVTERLPRITDRLSARLQDQAGLAGPPSFGAAVAQAVEFGAARLQFQLAQIRSPAHEEPAHRARLRAKWLRYVLEPVADEAAPAREAVQRLKDLQGVLGDLHDLQNLNHRLLEYIDARANDRTEMAERLVALSAGRQISQNRFAPLLGVVRESRIRQEQLFHPLAEDWLGGHAAPTFENLGELARRISTWDC